MYVYNLKVLCHDMRRSCVLMSSLFQIFNQRGYRKYGHAQYHAGFYLGLEIWGGGGGGKPSLTM